MNIRLYELRTERGWTKQDLANRAGVSRAAVSRLENGYRYGHIKVAVRIADALGVSLDTLFGREVAC